MNLEQIKGELVFTAVRSRGPGGQNVNKVASAAILNWNFFKSKGLSEDEKTLVRTRLESYINKEEKIFIRSDEFRDLERNKERCLEKLEFLLKRAFFKPKNRKATKPTKASKIRRGETKSRRGEIKKSRQKIWD